MSIEKDNIEYLVGNFKKMETIPEKSITKLKVFTLCNKIGRFISSVLPFPINNVRIKNFKYVITQNNKEYPFECLSDKKILKADKKILKSEKRTNEFLVRTLRIASSNKLDDAKVLVGFSDEFKTVVDYLKNGKRYIIDYENNIIMEKENYIELFKLKIINEINQAELYKIYYLFTEQKLDIHDIYLLFFTKEIFKDISKIHPLYKKGYDTNGINNNNDYLCGLGSENLYQEEYDNRIYDKKEEIIALIRKFTIDPTQKYKNIYSLGDGKYYYKKGLKKINFKLISDQLNDCKIKEDLLSENRYGLCHQNSIIILKAFRKQKAILVSGKIRFNDLEHCYHTWVELESNGKVSVIDYNSNVIMDKEDYYNIMDAKVINISDYDTIEKVINLLNDYEIYLTYFVFGYFSQELLRDLEKNKQLIK